MPLRDSLLQTYIDTFFGYGSYAGDWWLVGMEEGGGNTIEEVEMRLALGRTGENLAAGSNAFRAVSVMDVRT